MELNDEIIQEKKLVKINPETTKQFQIEKLNLTVVRFSLSVVEARIVLSDNIDKNSIQISEDLLEKNKVPITNDYHIMIKSKEIIIGPFIGIYRSEEHTSELQSRGHLVCRLLLEKKKQHRNWT